MLNGNYVFPPSVHHFPLFKYSNASVSLMHDAGDDHNGSQTHGP